MTQTSTEVKTQVQPSAQAEPTRQRVAYMPPTDVYETPDALVVAADVPGASQDSVTVDLERNVLSIRAAAPDHAPVGYSPVYGEYAVGDFERTFQLSDEIDRSGIVAKLRHGVLTLTLPKAKPKQKKIEIQSA